MKKILSLAMVAVTVLAPVVCATVLAPAASAGRCPAFAADIPKGLAPGLFLHGQAV